MRRKRIRLYSSPTRFYTARWPRQDTQGTQALPSQLPRARRAVLIQNMGDSHSLHCCLPAGHCVSGAMCREGCFGSEYGEHSVSALLPACRELCRQRSHLQGRPGEGPLVLGGERKHRARRGAAPVLDAVRLVEDHPPPPHLHSNQADVSRLPVGFLTIAEAGALRPRRTF